VGTLVSSQLVLQISSYSRYIIFYLDFLPFCLFVFLCLSQPCCFQRGWTESLDGFFAQFYMDSQGTSLAFISLFSLEG
jgi:hypothetical protein